MAVGSSPADGHLPCTSKKPQLVFTGIEEVLGVTVTSCFTSCFIFILLFNAFINIILNLLWKITVFSPFYYLWQFVFYSFKSPKNSHATFLLPWPSIPFVPPLPPLIPQQPPPEKDLKTTPPQLLLDKQPKKNSGFFFFFFLFLSVLQITEVPEREVYWFQVLFWGLL